MNLAATTDEWTAGWAWWGSWRDLENGPIFEPPAVVCSDACRLAHAQKHHLDPELVNG